MKTLGLLLGVAGLILMGVGLSAQQPAPTGPASQPPGINIVLYPASATAPLVVHVHGATGEVHIWIASGNGPPVGAAAAPKTASEIAEQKKLERIKELLSQQEKK